MLYARSNMNEEIEAIKHMGEWGHPLQEKHNPRCRELSAESHLSSCMKMTVKDHDGAQNDK